MVDYRIVKHCRICKKRFVVEKSERRRTICYECEQEIKDDPDTSLDGQPS